MRKLLSRPLVKLIRRKSSTLPQGRTNDVLYRIFSLTPNCSQPAREDAERITIPHIVLGSKKEAESIKQYADVFSAKGRSGEVDVYMTMSHGWMGTLADLTKPENVKEFEKGYELVLKATDLILAAY